MIYGYTRVSTQGQKTDSQRAEILKRYPSIPVLEDIGVSGMTAPLERPMFSALIKTLQKGDQVVVYGIDRLGRSAREVLETVELMAGMGVSIISIREGFDAATPAGKMMLTMLSAVAEMERSLFLERSRAGIEEARKNGKVFGRPAALDEQKLAVLLKRYQEGVKTSRIAADLGVSQSTVNRAVKKYLKAEKQ